MLSIIIPAYNEEEMIPIATKTIVEILENAKIDYELLFVNDGSSDFTWAAIKEECSNNPNVVGISFSRNFGKEAAIFAGLEKVKGDCAIIIDCDLQHPPEKIVDMYRLWEQGYEVVDGVKADRGSESKLHKFAAGTFYKLISRLTKIDMMNSSDFKLLDRRVIDVLNNLQEKHVFFRALSSWVGFKSVEVKFYVNERQEGTTKWSTKSLIKYAINNISTFSAAPMQVVTALGMIIFGFSVVLGVHSLVNWFMGNAANGFTTVILIQLLLGSVIMISVGIVGYYIAKIYEEVKGRPRYIISEVRGNKREEVDKLYEIDR